MPRVRFPVLLCLAGLANPTARAQTSDATALAGQLADPATRAAARERLLALGADATAALAARIGTATGDHLLACLDVLDQLGPAGGAAVPALLEPLRNSNRGGGRLEVEVRRALLATLAELIPHRANDVEIAEHDLVRMTVFARRGSGDEVAFATICTRLTERLRFPRGTGVGELLAAAAGRRPLAVEAAIERLGALGPAAARAVPLLRGVLDRPEPRVLMTDDHVPVHRKAARALLAIAPDAPAAAVARAVLAGTWSPPAPPEPAVPERARRRIAELLVELDAAEPARRVAAAENLTALGSLAAIPVAGKLDATLPHETVAAALDVLHRLGKQAAAAVPLIAAALVQLPADHTIAVVRVLGATVPWSTDAFLGPYLSMSVGYLTIQGHRIAGTIDVPFLNAFHAALNEMQVAIAIPVDGSVEQLRTLLDDGQVLRRRRALEVIVARGTECIPLLDAMAPMLTATHPVERRLERIDAQSSRVTPVDRTDEIQRLAAQAIVAIAPADHPLVATARERLAQPAAK